MKKVLSLVLVCVMICSVMLFAGCAQGTDSTKDEAGTADKTYVIYSDNAFAPFEYLDKDTNMYVGLDMDIMAAIAKDQGIKYEMHNEGFDASMGAVQSGQADAMIAGMTITDERKETFDFSESYFDDGQVLVVKKGSDIKSFDDLQGKSVACKTSTVSGEYAESVKTQYGFTTTYYEGSNEMYQAVINGVNDACIEDFSVVGYAITNEQLDLEIISEVLNVSGYGFATQKGQNAELIQKFNDGLKNIKASGEYKDILAKYGY